MAKPSRKSKRARPARGQVGLQTYEHVRKIVADKKLPVGKAFAEVAKATGRKPGTVAVTYYRIARQQGGPIRKRGAGKRRGRPAKAAASVKVLAVLARVAAAVDELKAVIAHQEREIIRLTSESKLAARIRQALRD